MRPVDPLVICLVAIPLVVPVVQLIPLPSAIWTTLPGRENELAALSLVGAQNSWRPISLSPTRTMASLLAIIPAIFCCYAISRLTLHERRLVLLTILVMAIVTSIFGAIQLTAGSPGINFYPQHHVGWVTGFQANRNAAADVLLIGFLALAALGAPYLGGSRKKLPMSLDRRSLSVLVVGLGLLLVAAIVMTGSRTGILLILVAGVVALVLTSLGRKDSRIGTHGFILLAAVLSVGFVIVFLALSQDSALVRVVERFSDARESRTEMWSDAWYALRQYWPVGFGMGGFESAMLPAERLEILDFTLPNRAHNDFLEVGLEAGLLGYILVIAAVLVCITMAYRARRDVPEMRRQVVFAAAVLILLALHSVVDYPLRSMAVACLAGIGGGMLARRVSPLPESPQSGSVEFAKGHA